MIVVIAEVSLHLGFEAGEIGMAWQKGQSGNPSGENYRHLTRALKVRLAADPGIANRIANKLLSMAEGGDIQATKLLFERLEGKAGQTIEQNVNITHGGSINITAEERKSRIRELLGSKVIDITPRQISGEQH